MSIKCAIWWTAPGDRDWIGARPGWPQSVPEYVRQEYASLHGRVGRGRLWVPPGLGEVRVDWPDPETPISLAANECGGIVLDARDAWTVASLPGFLTSTDLKWLDLSNTGAGWSAIDTPTSQPVLCSTPPRGTDP